MKLLSSIFPHQAAFLLCVHPVISLIGTFYSCSSATNEYKNIAFSLHKLSSCGIIRNETSLRNVEGFSLQLMMTKMQFTAKGFFEMSNKTLREVGKSILKFQTSFYGLTLDFSSDFVCFCDIFSHRHSVHAKMGYLSKTAWLEQRMKKLNTKDTFEGLLWKYSWKWKYFCYSAEILSFLEENLFLKFEEKQDEFLMNFVLFSVAFQLDFTFFGEKFWVNDLKHWIF